MATEEYQIGRLLGSSNYNRIFSSSNNSFPSRFFEVAKENAIPYDAFIYLNSIGYVTNETQYFTKESATQFLNFHREFNDWVHGAIENFSIQKIYILQIQPTFFDETNGISNGFVFVKFVKSDNYPGVALIRGNANAYFVILNVDTTKHVVFSKKTQIPGLQEDYLELIAGNNLTFVGILEKLKIPTNPNPKINGSKLVDMYPSIGGCNERVSLFQLELTISKEQLQQIRQLQSIHVMSYMEVVRKITTGEITDSKILSAFAVLGLKQRQKLLQSYNGGSKKYNTRRKIRKSNKKKT